MKKKILVILVCVLMIVPTTILITQENFQVKAADEGIGGSEKSVGINTTYIHTIAQDLSDIIFRPGALKGRSFGTYGEHYASVLIKDWMNQIGLYNVHTEEINGTAQHNDLNATLEILSKGIKINGTQTITDCFISPRWNTTFRSLLGLPSEDPNELTYNFSYPTPMPVYRKPDFPAFDALFRDNLFYNYLMENMSLYTVYDFKTFAIFCWLQLERIFNFIYENINISDPETLPSWYNGSLPQPLCNDHYLLIDEDPSFNPDASLPSGLDDFEPLSIPRTYYHSLKLIFQMSFWHLDHHNCQGLILYDFNNNTYDMTNGLLLARPVLNINGSIGRPIYDNATLINPSNREISFWINQRYNSSIKSYNVIGQINGTDPNKIVLIDCLYDCWWNQGTSDAAIGMGTVLALAKYFKDNKITPTYTLRFIAFGGEEYGYLGAQHYNDTHTNENIAMVFDLNQIGFSQTGPLPQTFFIHLNNESLTNLIRCITNDTHYEERTGTPFLHIGSTYYGAPSDDQPFAVSCLPSKGNRSLNTICFLKDMNWTLHHRDGHNHELGDVMTYYNETDINVTGEMIWNITKYFTVNPNCWFNGPVTYNAVDSPHDTDPDNDSINATFSVQTSLPCDRVGVKAKLISWPSNETVLWKNFNFDVTSAGTEKVITVTLPPNVTGASNGSYRLMLELYNSTGRIDDIVDNTGSYNDTDSQTGHVYLHTRGNSLPYKPDDIEGPSEVHVFELQNYSTSTTDSNLDQMQYQWAWRRDRYYWWLYEVDEVGLYDSGETCNITHMYLWAGDKTIQVRARDDYGYMFDWIHDGWTQYGDWSEWSDAFNVHTSLLTDFDMSCTSLSTAQNAMTSTEFPSIQNVDSIYNGLAFGGNEPYTYQWTLGRELAAGKNIEYDFHSVGENTVTLHVIDNDGESDEISVNVSVVNLSASFNQSTPSYYTDPGELIIFNDTSAIANGYHMANWTWDFGDGYESYSQYTNHSYDSPGVYNVTLTVTDNLSRKDISYHIVKVNYDNIPPEFPYVTHSPDTIGLGFNVTIAAVVTDNDSGVDTVCVNITHPDNTSTNYTMTYVINDTYFFVFNDTWQTGVYNYSIWAVDYANNTAYATGFNFMVSAEATITVCTTKDSYTGNEFINLTDPPGTPSPSLGYELIDDGAVLHLWNQYDNYYFNTSSGIQLTNHKDDFWSHNVLMLGYYNNNQWHLVYRTDELTGFSRAVETDNATFVNITLWKDLTYGGYSFRFALRYHLGVDDTDLTVIPSIKNTGTNTIPYVLGFGWELKDIQINMTTAGDYIMVDQDMYYLNQTLDNTYTDLEDPVFSIMENVTGSQTLSLYLKWDPGLTYKLLVKSRQGQENAPVTLFIRVGTLAVGQQKQTMLQWYDASQETFYFNAFDENAAWEQEPERMTDEDEGTSASTSVEGDEELCNENTCDGEDRGEILKVELRVNGYNEKDQGNITLRPMNGGNQGDRYTFITSGQPEWSEWFDITDDEVHEAELWNWSEVHDLGCLVISTDLKETLFCSKVELRVTYNTAPSISNPSPPYGVNGIALQPWLNITVSDPNGDAMNVTWYSNSTSRLLMLRPNANGSSTQLERYPTSQNANYQCIDETNVNDSDYVKWCGTTWKKDTYNLADHGNASGVIHGVTVYVRCGCEGYGSETGFPNTGKIILKSGNGYYHGNELVLSSTFTSYDQTWLLNPATGSAWTWSAIDALQAGINLTGDETGTSRCSHVYVVVQYTDPSTWLQIGGNSSVYDGVYHQRFLNASVNGQWWYWKVNADDGTMSTWSSVYKFYTGYQSKIENSGDTNISGYLLMQIQFYNTSQSKWLVDNDTVNETSPRTINSSSQLGLDTIFNGKIRASNLQHGVGTYRVYAAFKDPEGNILKTNTGSELEAAWQFDKT